MKNYYLNLNEKYDEDKITIFRNERKKLNREIFLSWNDSYIRTKKVNELFDEVFLSIMNELVKYDTLPTTNMIVREIFYSLKIHNLMSIFLNFRTLLISFVLEHKKYSVTQQKNKLNTFSKTLKEVDEIFESTYHFDYGMQQYKLDCIFEYNGKYEDELSLSKDNLANEESYKQLIKYCNKIAHREINFNDNNSLEAQELCAMAKLAISFTIALIINIIRFKIKDGETKNKGVYLC